MYHPQKLCGFYPYPTYMVHPKDLLEVDYVPLISLISDDPKMMLGLIRNEEDIDVWFSVFSACS